MRTGLSQADASDDFDQARQRATMARVGRWLRRQPTGIDEILPFDEVIAALGRVGERDLGLQSIPLDTIVGTVDRVEGSFDRQFRPRSERSRQRWVRLAEAVRRGEPMEPISAYRVGEAHFVRDGHHRVSVARAWDLKVIDGDVTEILTQAGASVNLRLADLLLKTHERNFLDRVPLPPEARERISLSRPEQYAVLAEGVEAWGFRAVQVHRRAMSREEAAREWFTTDYEPAVGLLRDGGLLEQGESETEAYLRLSALRYLLLRTHAWDSSVIDRLRDEKGRKAD